MEESRTMTLLRHGVLGQAILATALLAVDPGRLGGIAKLSVNPFKLLSRHNDDPSGASALRTRHAVAVQAIGAHLRTLTAEPPPRPIPPPLCP